MLWLFGVLVSMVMASSSQEETLWLSRQQTLYSQKKWDAFFGGAAFIRSRSNEAILDHSTALEIMALSLHCRWPMIESLAQETSSMGPLSQQAMKLVRMKKGYKDFLSERIQGTESLIAQTQKIRRDWSLTKGQLQKLASPDRVRAHVRSACD